MSGASKLEKKNMGMFSIRFPPSLSLSIYISFAENLYPSLKHCYPKDNASVDRAQVVIELLLLIIVIIEIEILWRSYALTFAVTRTKRL